MLLNLNDFLEKNRNILVKNFTIILYVTFYVTPKLSILNADCNKQESFRIRECVDAFNKCVKPTSNYSEEAVNAHALIVYVNV